MIQKINSFNMAKKFQTNTYTYLYASAKWIREQKIPSGYPGYDLYRKITFYTFLSFTLEAFLNHCGSHKISWWEDAERTLSTEAKLTIIFDLCKIDLKNGERPMQSLITLQRFRNEIAHGKTISTKNDFDHVKYFEGKFHTTKWDEILKKSNEDHLHDDLCIIVKKIWDALGFNSDHPDPFAKMGGTK